MRELLALSAKTSWSVIVEILQSILSHCSATLSTCAHPEQWCFVPVLHKAVIILIQIMAKLQYEDEWLQAMKEEDGFKLMYCLAREPREPRLLTIQYNGSSALHLAMKYNWYGLVQEILLQFKHILTRSGVDEKDEDVLRDLLTCKEGSSGLDVLGMAVIQCHKAINTLLISMFFPRLFRGGVYERVYRGSPREENLDSTESKPVVEQTARSRERSLLLRITGDYFPHLLSHDWWATNCAPNMCFGYGADLDKRDGSRAKFFELDSKIEPEVCKWMLTSPFLPFEEYFVLEYSRMWSKRNDFFTFNNDDSNFTFGTYVGSITGLMNPGRSSFIKYLLTISDTRRTVWHYAVLNSYAAVKEQKVGYRTRIHPFLSWIDSNTDQDSFNIDISEFWKMKDSSYRTVAHLILASESAPLDNLQLSLQYASKWEPVERQSWEYNGLICWLNLRLVHEVNGSVYFSTKSEIIVGGYRSLTFEQILLTSPHLTETDRTVRLESILKLGLEPRSCCLRPSVHAGVTSDRLFTPLQYYLLMGYSDLVQLMAEDDECYDPARINNQIHQAEGIFAVLPPNELCLHFMPKSALHLAAERADSEILRIILETGKFDPHFVDAEKGNTLLHPAARCEATTFLPAMLIDYVEIPEKFSSNSGVEQRPMIKDQQSEKEERHHESRRQGCVNLLLQEGLDIWETNKSGRIPGPGPKASPEYSLWWYEKLAHETQDQKTSFSAAATAISVTAALVATASYIGPLQPPLGYSLEDEDQIAKIQAEVLPVRVFFVCNTFAFYLAIAAVVFSLTPSLPMPHESTHGELNRIRRSVTSALVLLILSLVAILSAFASTSIVVIPNGKRWNHGWLTASSVIVGSIGCIVALIFSCTRAVRLLCHDNSIVSRIYSKWVCI